MGVIISSFGLFAYGAYMSLYEKVFNGKISRRLSCRKPLTDRRIIRMSEICHERRKKFEIMEKRLKLKIANKIKM